MCDEYYDREDTLEEVVEREYRSARERGESVLGAMDEIRNRVSAIIAQAWQEDRESEAQRDAETRREESRRRMEEREKLLNAATAEFANTPLVRGAKKLAILKAAGIN